MKEDDVSTAPTESKTYTWDVFISHSTGDKVSLVLPLTKLLEQAGLRVWLDTKLIEVGDLLRSRVNEGISKSRFGVVILSPSYLEKKWTMDELDALMALEQRDTEIVLPILHKLSRDSVALRYPLLANRTFIDSSVGVDKIAAAIISVVLKKGFNCPSDSFPTVRRRFLNLIEGATTPEEVRHFLQHYPQIICRAVGSTYEPSLAWTPLLGGVSPDLCVSNLLPTAGRREWHVIFLGPLASRAFTEQGRPVPGIQSAVDDLKKLRNWLPSHYLEARGILSDITAEFSGVVVAGRRAGRSADQAKHLERYNDFLFGTRIRTYDWLIEAS